MKVTRQIVRIDEEKCNGCGDCVPGCAEGALRIVNGKARLVAENLCDGLGACLGHCPLGAITVEEHEVDEFDESAVAARLGQPAPHAQASHAPARTSAFHPQAGVMAAHVHGHAHGGGCPGSQPRFLQPRPVSGGAVIQSDGGQRPSRLGQWPVQLTLVPTAGPMWQDADVLLAADCVPFACAEFHDRLLAGKTLAIACPKLDDVEPYLRKLAGIFAANPIRSVTVAIMEVPCCAGLYHLAQTAIAQAGREDIELKVAVVGVDGTLRK